MSIKPKKIKWNAFEHFLWRELHKLPLMTSLSVNENEAQSQLHFLIALSGGADSVALLKALKVIQVSSHIRISAMYIHHGKSEERDIQSYRDRCESFCSQLCAKEKIDFQVSAQPIDILKSEEDFRDFRYQQLFAHQNKIGAKILITAHHCEDLFETRLLRLIRGTGTDGLVGMKTWQSLKLNENQMIFLWRPLLKVSKQELLNYLNGISVEYIADPSNFSNDFLRNWLRNEWLPQLEQKVSGSVKSFARSLEILTESIQGNEELDPIDLLIQSVTDDFQLDKNGQLKIKYFVRRIDLLALSISQRKQCIVKLLKRANIDKISSGQVNEILKQLDNPQKMHKFGFNNCVWVVDAERVFVE